MSRVIVSVHLSIRPSVDSFPINQNHQSQKMEKSAEFGRS